MIPSVEAADCGRREAIDALVELAKMHRDSGNEAQVRGHEAIAVRYHDTAAALEHAALILGGHRALMYAYEEALIEESDRRLAATVHRLKIVPKGGV